MSMSDDLTHVTNHVFSYSSILNLTSTPINLLSSRENKNTFPKAGLLGCTMDTSAGAVPINLKYAAC